ncbi:hypothetical protein RJ640_013195 [Escallonia rubra]|uniref:Mediator of RNA polymerase II transcription subunit 13 n=1 Tax=Escallonia rubra TaxID=112253 RepID=A0AA88QWM1_9ASTE|nr:hypothetical protein RJ640_013195 [Escallonia rubra]
MLWVNHSPRKVGLYGVKKLQPPCLHKDVLEDSNICSLAASFGLGGGLHQVSWFQFLPHEPDLNPLPDKSVKADQKDAATLLVLSSHLQLQKEGFLSTWTNSFVGPWDPSQGLHNPDEKIKLWLFLPGRYSSVDERAQPAVSRLRVLASGLWLAPGDSEEVATALSQALMNCIERALTGLSYMRFGNVFARYHPFSQSEELSRRGQPVIEFIFAATEEAIFVHALISAKHIRALSSSDMEMISKHSPSCSGDGLPVVVSPHGMRGRLTGCCPADLVKQAFFSSGKFRASDGIIGLPYQVSQGSGCQLRGKNCYLEVTLGCFENEKALQPNSNLNKNFTKQHNSESSAVAVDVKKGSADLYSRCERTFIYPAEAVLVPVVQTSFARSSLKRFWLQNWMGPSLSDPSFLMHCYGMDGSWLDQNGSRSQHGYHSSGNSNSSSISSISTSSDSDYKMSTGAGDLEADADSLICQQSGLSSADQSHDGSKRSRPGSQVGAVLNSPMQDAYKSDYGSMEVNNSAITGDANEQVGWDWDDDRGGGMDIQALLSEFGDFGDFFENDTLPFGEHEQSYVILILIYLYSTVKPPGTAESQALMFSGPDCGNVGSSPGTGIMDISDQMLLPVGFPSYDTFNPPPVVTEESLSKSQEVTKNTLSSGILSYTPATSTGEFDYIIKSEALMTFAPEYGAVETPGSEFTSFTFRSPYIPKSREVESANSSSNNYVYSATPPSPCFEESDEKPSMALSVKARLGGHDASGIHHSKKYYTHIATGKEQHDNRLLTCNSKNASSEGAAQSRPSVSSSNAVKSIEQKSTDGTLGADNLLISMKTVLANEVECVMFQAYMCRIRHTLISSSSPLPVGSSCFSGSNILYPLHGDSSIMTDSISSRYEVKKKESIPVRIAGDIDVGMLDGPLHAPVGVWRSVGVPRGSKPNTPNMEVFPSLPHNSFNEEGMLSFGQRQPLQEFLNGMALLVQQATSFVDVALDADCGDGPYGWLALQEQWRRGFSCGPSMVHAGCGGVLASCHSLDIAGLELVDPLSADVCFSYLIVEFSLTASNILTYPISLDAFSFFVLNEHGTCLGKSVISVHASSAISLLQSDIKSGLKSAFAHLDGPLCVTDWCKGRSLSGDAGSIGDGFSADSSASVSEYRDSPSIVTPSAGDPISPSQSSAGGSSCLRGMSTVFSGSDGGRADEVSERRSSQETCISESEPHVGLRVRPSLFVLPFPSILVGYQDDWLKTSASSLQLWEKAPFEPYAMQKHMAYYVVCPDIDPLTTAATDFFHQLGTVYETCKLGTHSPQSSGNQMDIDSGKWSSSGFVLLDCPQSMKIESSGASLVGSISDYFLSLSNGWDLTSYLRSLSKVLKALKLGPSSTTNLKEGSSGPCTVIYVVCPFPEPIAVLKTVVEASTAVGSIIFSSDKERRSIMHNQVGKALSCSTAVDEASISNVVTLSGFSIPKLILQIVTVDTIFRVTSPALNELVILKEIAFTVYNKARRMSRGPPSDVVPSASISGRSHSALMQMTSPVPGMWKDCLGPRIAGTSLQREGELDANLRAGTWDNSWQMSRSGGLGCDSSRIGDFLLQDETRYMFEPLFILAEPGSIERGISNPIFVNPTYESSKLLSDDDTSGSFMQSSVSSASGDTGAGSQLDGSEQDGFGSGHQKTLPSLHCCYGWTEDWRWLVCVWTDSRGELLDSSIFPFGGISSRQDTKGLQFLFVQILQQGCQILQACSPDSGIARPRDFVITRIGCFFELECQEWQKALYSVGGSEVKKWPLQLRRSVPDGMAASSNGTSLQQQEMSMIQERTLPSSPNPLYSPHSKASAFLKGGLGQPSARKQLMGGHTVVDNSRGLLQWVQSISFISVSVDHSLQLVFQADSTSPGVSQASGTVGQSGYLEGFTPVKSLGSTSASYVMIPSPSMRFLPPNPLQLPTCLTSESPPLAHLLHSKGSAIPLSTGFVVSKAVPSMRKDSRNSKEEWPSVLSVNLVDYYGGSNVTPEKMVKGVVKPGGREARDSEIETHLILESVAAEINALSWMTVSPAYLERRTPLPFHCDMVLRLRRLLHFADKELCQLPER